MIKSVFCQGGLLGIRERAQHQKAGELSNSKWHLGTSLVRVLVSMWELRALRCFSEGTCPI